MRRLDARAPQRPHHAEFTPAASRARARCLHGLYGAAGEKQNCESVSFFFPVPPKQQRAEPSLLLIVVLGCMDVLHGMS